MQLKNISKNARTIWIIRNIISLIFVTAFFAFWFMISLPQELNSLTPLSVIIAVIYLIIAVLFLIWPFLSYKRYLYAYDDKRFFITKGVIFKHQITVPICQIQDLHLFEGPVMRIFGIGKIIFATGGSNFDISGIALNEAKKIIEEVEERLRKRIEVIENEEI